jgi:osmotically inducible lipoprotein OsmB
MKVLTISMLITVAIATAACNTTEQRVGGAAVGAGTGAAVGGPVGAVVGGAAGAVAAPTVVQGTRRATRRR